MVSKTPPRGLALGLLWILGVLMALIGLAIGIGGAYLVSLGGSGYFMLMGIAMLISAVLILKKISQG